MIGGNYTSRSHEMRLPDFLVIGAMKAGTTTIQADLSQHPDIAMSRLKELAILTSDAVLSEDGLRDYALHFSHARPQQLCGEASTQYTKIPQYEGCAQRAIKVLRSDLTIFYAVRHPIGRIISQYEHEYSRGATDLLIDDAVRQDERYLAFSSYHRQLLPWLETFGSKQVRIVQFETYMADRAAGMSGLLESLSLQPGKQSPEVQLAVDKVHLNNSATKYRLTEGRIYRTIIGSKYQTVRPFIPQKIRNIGQRIFGRRREPPKLSLEPETIAYLKNELADDHGRFLALLGRPERPLWNLEQTRGLVGRNCPSVIELSKLYESTAK